MPERRYDEAEVAAIFQRATEAPTPGQGAGAGITSGTTAGTHGLTLAELQEIGRDVGIPADAIALAARTVDHVAPPASRTFLGLPIGVAHTANLGRRLSEEEWERLVVDLRETFDARGRVSSHGSLHQWTNGNLQALLEPTPTGHRIRLRTMKSDAIGLLVVSLGMIGFSAMSLIAAAVQGALGDAGMVAATGFLGLAGAGLFAANALRLPRWARTRRRQMEEVAARAALAAAPEETRGQIAGHPDSENDVR